MTPEQEIRAAGIQAAAALCAPISGGLVPPLNDILFVAHVFTEYIENGAAAAQQVYATSEASKVDAPAETVVIAAAGPQIASVDSAPSVPATPAAAPSNVVPISGRPEPLAARAEAPTPASNPAREKIEKLKKERAEKILAVARAAKVAEQKDHLRKLSTESGLDEVVVSVDNASMPLGQYLKAL